MTLSPQASLPWIGATRAEMWAGEVRANLFRLIAIGAFYGHHLVDYYWLRVDSPRAYHLVVSGIAGAWALGAWILHLCLARQWNPPPLKYSVLGWDALMMTSLMAFSGGPKSPFIVLLFFLIATAPLRMELRAVWVATLLALLAYGFESGHSYWKRPEWRVTRREHVIFGMSLIGAGVLAGQAVRQARRFALDYADRIRPEEKAAEEERIGTP
jgi:hypothetical protein